VLAALMMLVGMGVTQGTDAAAGSAPHSCGSVPLEDGVVTYECEYLIYPEGWRCGGSIQAHFQCWNGASSPARASEIFEGSDEIEIRPRAYLRMLTVLRPVCSRHALAKALHRGGLPGQIHRDAFGCAGHFAWAGAIVHHDGEGDEITVLFKAGRGSWHPVSRGRFCEDGAVPKTIYQPACESN
jgi:hypothetical protein